MPLTIYFSGSITGGRGDVALYRQLVDMLESCGHRVLAGSVAAETVDAGGDPLDPRVIFDRDMTWIAEADVLVAEVSTPSLGVGYEIAAALYEFEIPVLALYRNAYTSRCSAMISGDPAIELLQYETLGELVPKLRESLARLPRSTDRLP